MKQWRARWLPRGDDDSFLFLWGSRSKKDMRGYAGGHQNCPSINLSTVQEDPQVTWVLIDDNWKKNLFLKTVSSHVLFLDECNEFLTSFFSIHAHAGFEYQVMGWPVRTDSFFLAVPFFFSFSSLPFFCCSAGPQRGPRYIWPPEVYWTCGILFYAIHLLLTYI